MANTTVTFQIIATDSLTEDDDLIYQFVCKGHKNAITNTANNNFTASINAGSLSVSSTAVSTGYVVTTVPFITGSSSNNNGIYDQITFSSGLSRYYGDDYVFAPNPLSGSISSSLYNQYGDVSYSFKPEKFDLIILQLSDNTYIQSTILNVSIAPTTNLLSLTLDKVLGNLALTDIKNKTYKRFLLLKKLKNEQNVILTFKKAPGETSYGFVIPDTINPDVLAKINSLQASIQAQLLSTQANTGQS